MTSADSPCSEDCMMSNDILKSSVSKTQSLSQISLSGFTCRVNQIWIRVYMHCRKSLMDTDEITPGSVYFPAILSGPSIITHFVPTWSLFLYFTSVSVFQNATEIHRSMMIFLYVDLWRTSRKLYKAPTFLTTCLPLLIKLYIDEMLDLSSIFWADCETITMSDSVKHLHSVRERSSSTEADIRSD